MRGFSLFFSLLLLFLCLLPLQGEAQEEIWYMRVIARDDSPAAQREKFLLRNAVLALCPVDAAGLPAALPAMEAAAWEIAPCKMEIKIWSPHEKAPPAPTLYITIGEGGGKNWWGILYPDAVLMARSAQSPPACTDEKITFVWPWLSWLKALLTPASFP